MLAGGGGLQSVPRSLHVAPPGHSAVVDVHAPALHISAVVKVIPVHDWAAPQAVPFALLLPSMQSGAPVVHEIIPCLQFLVGLVVHDMPAVQETQLPALLHTMLTPQLAPGSFCVLLSQTVDPLLQLVMPVKQGSGLFVQL